MQKLLERHQFPFPFTKSKNYINHHYQGKYNILVKHSSEHEFIF